MQQTSLANCQKKNISTKSNAPSEGSKDIAKHAPVLTTYKAQAKKTSTGGNRSVLNGKGKKKLCI